MLYNNKIISSLKQFKYYNLLTIIFSLSIIIGIITIINNVYFHGNNKKIPVSTLSNCPITAYNSNINSSYNSTINTFKYNSNNEKETNNVSISEIPKIDVTKKSSSTNITPSGSFNDFFENAVFLGDSITKGFSSYHFLEDSKICAEIGINTDKVSSMVGRASDLKADKVFILCGINDMGTLNNHQFSEHYTNLIHNVKAKMPNSRIYVQSILPVLPQLEETKSYIKNSYIEAYNNEIIEIAKNEKITYLNITDLAKGNTNFYATDGLHYKSDFYPLWLKFIFSKANTVDPAI